MNQCYDLYEVNAKISFRNNIKIAFFRDNPTQKFKKISVERKEEIEVMASLWSSLYNHLPLEDKFYEIIKEIKNDQGRGFEKKYNLFRGDEKHVFLLSAFDPSLKMLKISLDSSDKDDYFKKVKEEFGFFPDQRVLLLEKFYNARFSILENDMEPRL